MVNWEHVKREALGKVTLQALHRRGVDLSVFLFEVGDGLLGLLKRGGTVEYSIEILSHIIVIFLGYLLQDIFNLVANTALPPACGKVIFNGLYNAVVAIRNDEQRVL